MAMAFRTTALLLLLVGAAASVSAMATPTMGPLDTLTSGLASMARLQYGRRGPDVVGRAATGLRARAGARADAGSLRVRGLPVLPAGARDRDLPYRALAARATAPW
jgi:hypothetical protein